MEKKAANPRNVFKLVKILAEGDPDRIRRAVGHLSEQLYIYPRNAAARVYEAASKHSPVGSNSLEAAMNAIDAQYVGLPRHSLIRSAINLPAGTAKSLNPALRYSGVSEDMLTKAVRNALRATGRKDPKGYVNALVEDAHALEARQGWELANLLKNRSLKLKDSPGAIMAKGIRDRINGIAGMGEHRIPESYQRPGRFEMA
jgi:hypothetical protein